MEPKNMIFNKNSEQHIIDVYYARHKKVCDIFPDSDDKIIGQYQPCQYRQRCMSIMKNTETNMYELYWIHSTSMTVYSDFLINRDNIDDIVSVLEERFLDNNYDSYDWKCHDTQYHKIFSKIFDKK